MLLSYYRDVAHLYVTYIYYRRYQYVTDVTYNLHVTDVTNL